MKKNADGFFKEAGPKEELSATRLADQKAVDTAVCMFEMICIHTCMRTCIEEELSGIRLALIMGMCYSACRYSILVTSCPSGCALGHANVDARCVVHIYIYATYVNVRI